MSCALVSATKVPRSRETAPPGLTPGTYSGGLGRVDGGRGGYRLRESLFPAAFALTPVPQSRPWLRFPPPLIELGVQISRTQLSDGIHDRACTGHPGLSESSRAGLVPPAWPCHRASSSRPSTIGC